MATEKFAKALTKIIKSDELNLDPWFAVIISGFITYCHHLSEENKVDEDIVDAYRVVITKLLKKDVKKVLKKYDVAEDEVYNMLIELPSVEHIDEPKFVIPFAQRIFRQIYAKAREEGTTFDSKTLRKVVRDVYGKEYVEYFSLAALLEKKDNIKQFNEKQLSAWSMVTDFALDYIEKQKKDDIKDIVLKYAERRKSDAKREKGVVTARRLEFSSINTEDYPKLRSVTDKLKDSKKNNLREFI